MADEGCVCGKRGGKRLLCGACVSKLERGLQYGRVKSGENKGFLDPLAGQIAREAAGIIERSGQSGALLDVGCGTGFFVEQIGRLTAAPKAMIGIDINDSFDYNGERSVFIKGDIFDPPFLDGIFKIVTSFDVIEHIEDDKGFVNGILRMLAPGGIFIIGTPNLRRITAMIADVFRGKRVFPYSYGRNDMLGEITHVREYTRESLAALFECVSGIEGVDIRGIFLGIRFGKSAYGIERVPGFASPFSHYWMVSGKKKR